MGSFQPKPGSSPTWSRTEYDFGKVRQGKQLRALFTCYNGDDTLKIENVLASCGCIATYWQKTPVIPKDSTDIKLLFNTNGKSGKYTKVITVYTNLGFYELIIKADISKD